MTWIEYSNKEPPNGTLVLCLDMGASAISSMAWVAWHSKGDWIDRNGRCRLTPTHWMLLPDLPLSREGA